MKHRPLGVAGGLGEVEWPIDGIIGPIGSGKTVAACIKVFVLAMEQPVQKDGWRRSRWAVVRNTNPMLELTTIPTWLSWFPEDYFGKFNWSPPFTHHIRHEGMKLDMEVVFIPLDRPDQVRNLLSMELTGGFVNEAREVPREILTALRSRCGRYPSLRDTDGQMGWAGVLFDTNAPEDELHYLMMWSGRTEPPDWMSAMDRRLMFKPEGITIMWQPPALVPVKDKAGNVLEFEDNPKAENVSHLRGGMAYYRAQLAGQTTAWVLNMICCEARAAAATRPVHPTFRRALHVAGRPLEWVAGRPALFGMDFARNPALVLAQEVDGQLRYLREWIGQNESVEQFLARVIPEINAFYPGALGGKPAYRGWGDPSGSARTGADDNTAFRQSRASGLVLVPAPTNDPDERQAALDRRLDRLVSGDASVVFCPRGCPTMIAGYEAMYRFRRLKVSGTIDQFTEEVEKNLYSHVCEAGEYLVLGLDRAGTQSDRERRAAARSPQPNGAVRIDPLALARAARRGGGRASMRSMLE